MTERLCLVWATLVARHSKAAGNAHARQVYETEGYAVTNIDASRGWGEVRYLMPPRGICWGSSPGVILTLSQSWNVRSRLECARSKRWSWGDITLAPAILVTYLASDAR